MSQAITLSGTPSHEDVNARSNAGEPAVFRFNVDQYWQMYRDGLFDDRRVELVEGEVVEMAAQEQPHDVSLNKTRIALEHVFGPGYFVRTQATVNLQPFSAPDPDVSVVEGALDDWSDRPTPTSALLIVEVSVSTLSYDRHRKSKVYAAAGIAEYWIVNVTARELEVHRTPRPDAESRTGSSYASIVRLAETQRISPLARPSESIAIADLLPRRSSSST